MINRSGCAAIRCTLAREREKGSRERERVKEHRHLYTFKPELLCPLYVPLLIFCTKQPRVECDTHSGTTVSSCHQGRRNDDRNIYIHFCCRLWTKDLFQIVNKCCSPLKFHNEEITKQTPFRLAAIPFNFDFAIYNFLDLQNNFTIRCQQI